MYIINNKMKFNIESWNVIMLNNNPNNRTPAVYLKLTEELYMLMLMTYGKSNMFNVKIGDTNNIYGDIIVDGYFFSSVNTPNFRPNFYMQNGYITIVLNCEWKGYPDPRDCGTIEIMQRPDVFLI